VSASKSWMSAKKGLFYPDQNANSEQQLQTDAIHPKEGTKAAAIVAGLNHIGIEYGSSETEVESETTNERRNKIKQGCTAYPRGKHGALLSAAMLRLLKQLLDSG
jgi:hypothetical protein